MHIELITFFLSYHVINLLHNFALDELWRKEFVISAFVKLVDADGNIVNFDKATGFLFYFNEGDDPLDAYVQLVSPGMLASGRK